MESITIGIAGLGLIGGSLALGLATRTPHRIVGFDRDRAALDQARAAGAIVSGTDDPRSPELAAVDLLFLATPLGVLPETAAELAPSLRACRLAVDLGSSKGQIVEACRRVLPCPFVGGHPMAGNQFSGFAAARPDLLDGAPFLLTLPEPASPELEPAVAWLQQILQPFGFRFVRMDATTHDRSMAFASHLPYFVATALAATAMGRAGELPITEVAASGFRDTTRLAAANPVLGRDMAVTNREALLEGIAAFAGELETLRRLVADGDAERLLAHLGEVQAWRTRYFP